MNKTFHYNVGVSILIVVFLTSIVLTACSTAERDNLIGNQTAYADILVETKYAPLTYPKEYEGKLTTKEVVQNGVSVVIFNAIVAEENRELFRIYFNDESMGALFGYITHGSDEIPVSYDVAEYEDDIFKTEDMKKDYYSLMDAFQAVIDSIYANPQFRTERREIPVEDRVASMKYWEVTIPDNVYWEEFESEVVYRVDFYGFAEDDRVELYSVGFGIMDSDYSIGSFSVNGETHEILVRIHDIPEEYLVDESDRNKIYRMLESVNSVVDAIMAEE